MNCVQIIYSRLCALNYFVYALTTQFD